MTAKKNSAKARKGMFSKFPSLGKTGTIFAISGLFIGTLAISIAIAVFIRTLFNANLLTFFGDGMGDVVAPFATADPANQADMLDIGNAEKWSGNDPVTILLMGGDLRPDEGGRPRTDTMMLLMIDPRNDRASLLSIPRDLYVDVPGYGLQRVNAAYRLGGGPLAIETIQYNLGIRVNYYVMIDFNVFTTLIDEIGGIDVYVPMTIYDPSYPDMNFGYDPLYVEAGWQHMDGALALKYARTRHQDSDFHRAQRQQDVLFAIRDKVLSLEMLPTLVQRAPTLYSQLQEHVFTDMSFTDMVSLALLLPDIPTDSIRKGMIGPEHTQGYMTDSGASVIIPLRTAIGPYLEYIFWLTD